MGLLLSLFLASPPFFWLIHKVVEIGDQRSKLNMKKKLCVFVAGANMIVDLQITLILRFLECKTTHAFSKGPIHWPPWNKKIHKFNWERNQQTKMSNPPTILNCIDFVKQSQRCTHLARKLQNSKVFFSNFESPTKTNVNFYILTSSAKEVCKRCDKFQPPCGKHHKWNKKD